MTTSRQGRWVWLLAAALGGVCVVLAAVVVVVLPPELSFTLPVALAALVVALLGTAVFLARYLPGGDPARVDSIQRWVSLIAGLVAAGVLLAMAPALWNFAAPLGSGVTTIVVAALVVIAVSLAAMSLWSFIRRPTARVARESTEA